ncbi:DNA methyltransferase [Dyadobacter frigoris]|uniref:Methyltransferase n=1 Tax=Dyadobacter frigoris TaxID=2576211 RepID=A0A4V6BKV1_9BACT|nr:DNA methyltransferase [Dyadobacter frigoris]TKT94263.1 site-specific DNA-methyltransferase [Dyadobacter frigoris]GLU50547.1 hypothetical protein Dfri01_00080 [Dyadobacter frigoris]
MSEVFTESLQNQLLIDQFNKECVNSAVGSEWSLHQLSPYIGKIKSSIAKYLIENFTQKGDLIFDPFCGAGTIPLEAWSLGRNAIGNDLNKYAFILTSAKLSPPNSLNEIISEIEKYDKEVSERVKTVNLANVPEWVQAFFHPETLREIIVWTEILKTEESWFILSCLLGILHHQRPGFLSHPSSHTVPYLRTNKFPKGEFPSLYEYRSVKDRLIKKIIRATKKQPNFDLGIGRHCYNEDASKLIVREKIDAIITSPPYMRQLNYARDNRLRLWFLGVENHKVLDEIISPKEIDFIKIITDCLKNWNEMLSSNGKCILFLGDNYSKKYKVTLPEIISNILINDIGKYELTFKHESLIPSNRRVRRDHSGNKIETILVFQKIA